MRVQLPRNTFPGRLMRARDGDTVHVLFRFPFDINIELPVRLIGIESWELASPDRQRALAAAKWIEARYRFAEVCVRAQPRGRDCYGRVRGHIITQEGDLGQILIHNGQAWNWPTDKTGPTAAAAAEENATS